MVKMKTSMHSDDNDLTRDDGEQKQEYFRSDSTGHEALNLRLSRRASLKRKDSSRFSILMSTEEFNSEPPDTAGYYGPYAHIRRRLDYDFHAHYKKERQWLQDSIVEDCLFYEKDSPIETPTEPWLLYTVGVMGAGKHYALSELVRDGRLPLFLPYVFVDPHDIRRRLPEFESYQEECACDPDCVDELTRKEAGYVAELIVRAALQAGRNVVWDTSLYSAEWFLEFSIQIREEFSSVKVGIIHVTAPRDVILDRVEKHWTNRTISEEKIDSTMELIPRALRTVSPVADYICTIYNPGDELSLDSDETWESFCSNFVQTSSWKLSPIPKRKVISDQDNEEKKEGLEAALAIPKPRGHRRRRTFSVLLSTEANHSSSKCEFFGPYSHIRETLDYKYHMPYTRERQTLQDAIITDMLDMAVIKDKNGDVCTTPTEPWIVFTAGAMGSGKSYTMNKLVEEGRFPLLAFVAVDPDEIRRHMPEFHLYVEREPELAGELTRKEAGHIAEILTLAGLIAGKNVLVDGSLRDWEWYEGYFERLRHEFPSLRIAIIHVTASRDAVFQRAAERALTTGRVVPKQTLLDALEQVPKSVQILAPLADYYCELRNDPDTPDIELVTEGETWEHFTKQWIQTCAWVPPRRSRSSLDLTSKLARAERTISSKSLASMNHSSTASLSTSR